jgi:hypothetical protein
MRLHRNNEARDRNPEGADCSGIALEIFQMKHKPANFFVCAVIGVLSVSAGHAQYIIESSTSLFTPSFRGEANSTWFGWGAGEFFATPATGVKRRLLDPSPTSGNVGLANGVEFFQLDWTDTNQEVIGSSSNNIYKGGFGSGTKPEVSLRLNVPTFGEVGLGFTTLIVQGTSLTGGSFGTAEAFLINQPIFGDINGISPDFVMAATADNRAQFWVKYELLGNQSIFEVPIFLPTTGNTAPISISGLTVDSNWSETGFASDFALVPEPSTWLLVGVGFAVLLIVRRRARSGRVG